MKQINITVTSEGIAHVRDVPEDVKVVVVDLVEDTIATFGEGNNNVETQKI